MTRIAGCSVKPFDAEGVANTRLKVIDNGRLTTWFLDLRSSRQLGLETTGHASRDTARRPDRRQPICISPPGLSARKI